VRTTLIFIIGLLLKSNILMAQLESVDNAEYYNKAIKYYSEDDFPNAEKYFTLSLDQYWAVDAFYNRALTRIKMGNERGYCEDLYMATANGDSATRSMFLKDCTINDTSHFENKIRIMAHHIYDSIIDSVIIDLLGNAKWYNSTDNYYLIKSNDAIQSKYSYRMPSFPGEENGLTNFVHDNFKKYSDGSYSEDFDVIKLTFVITKEGKIDNVKVLKGFDEEVDNAAIELVRSMPPWFPGMQNGKFVAVQFNLPITIGKSE
jgi:TonB family protein